MKRRLFILLSVCTTIAAMAQLPHSYSCDFEDAAENAQWNLNTPKNKNYEWPNLWVIGEAEAMSGSHSLYMSADGGNTSCFLSKNAVMIACRELQLEAGGYDMVFDWKNIGDSLKATMMVAWVPESDFGDMYCTTNTDHKSFSWIKNNLLLYNNTDLLCDASVWTHALMHFTSDGTPHRLVFIFLSMEGASNNPPSACVDNIYIAQNTCGEPTDRKSIVSGTNVTLSWSCAAQSYNIKFVGLGAIEPILANGITENHYQCSLEPGVYNVFIQCVCNGVESVWYDFPVVVVHDQTCLDYLDLKDERCFYYEKTENDYHKNESFLQPGKIDLGFVSMFSRHTIHYNPDEYDARTLGSIDSEGHPVPPLKTVPKGALASVRIGSWEEKAHVVRIGYEFTVDAQESAVLLLQYALILQASGHDRKDRPRLTIDIQYAETGISIDSTCTTIDLAAETSGDGWYRVPKDPIKETPQDVCWRDWTSLGLNLKDYDGMRMKVILTAYGCTADVHYGYAYFTLNCLRGDGNIEGIQCGNTPTNEFIAPDGFDYRWYKLSNPNNTLGSDRIYPVDYRDTEDYAVDVIYKSKAGCKFTLYANAIPRFPIPEATYTLEQHDCGNYIRFHNTSHIRTRDWTTGKTVDTEKKPESILWDFGGLMPDSLMRDSMPWNPTFRLPDEEADYHFTLKAMVGLCDSVQHFYIHVPRVGKDSVVENMQRCVGDILEHNGRFYSRDTTIIDYDYSRIGCDSVHVINLRFVDVIRDTVNAVIPEGESYLFDGNSLTVAGEYSATFMSASGCDSIVTLYLRVVVPLEMELAGIESPCPEDASFLIYIRTRKGEADYYTLRFDDESFAQGWATQSDSIHGLSDTIEILLPTGAKPGYYSFVMHFDSHENGKYDLTGEVMVHYSASLIQQRWDDVLGILNADYNGGYDFVSFQWLHNGSEVEGATGSYYYEAGKLKPGDEYAVLLTTTEGGRAIPTCSYIVPALSQPAPAVVAKKQLENGRLCIIVDGATYNAQGHRIR